MAHLVRCQESRSLAFLKAILVLTTYDKRANMDGLRDHMGRFRDSLFSTDHEHMSVNDLWVNFKSEFTGAMEKFIPSKI